MVPFFQKKYLRLLFFALLFLSCFAFNNQLSLWDQDEAAYAGFAKNMLETGNWLIPEFTWSEIHRKPPLHFWNIAISYQIFGVNEFAVRFPSALFIFLTYVVLYLWGSRLFGKKQAFISTIVLGTSFFVPTLSKVSVTDATVLFFSTLCAFSTLEVLRNRSWWAILLFWLGFALALLTKGPPIIIFTTVFIFLLAVLHPHRKNLLQLHPWFLLPIAIAPLLIWGYLAYLKNPDFINWMIDWYILKRINGSVLGQTAPPGFHLLLIIAFFIPYLIYLPKAIWTGLRNIFKDKGEDLLLSTWLIAGWLIYEFSPSKLPAYSIVAHVPLAMLIGKIIIHHLEGKIQPPKILIWVQFPLLLLLSWAIVGGAFYLKMPLLLKSTTIVFAIIVSVVIIFILKNRDNKNFIPLLLTNNIIYALVLLLFILPQLDALKNSTKQIANYIDQTAAKKSVIILANDYAKPPSLPFYNEMHFEKVISEKVPETLISMYSEDKPYVFVANLAQMWHFRNEFENVEVKEFSSFFVDRKGKANYFVVLNEKAKKKDQSQ